MIAMLARRVGAGLLAGWALAMLVDDPSAQRAVVAAPMLAAAAILSAGTRGGRR